MKRKILIALLALVIVLVSVPAAAGLFVDIPYSTIFGLATSAKPQHSAGFYPYDTYAYVAVDAKPTFGNIGELLKLREGFSDAAVLADFFGDLFEGTGTDAGIELKDVSPWIDFRHSAGVTDAGEIAIIGVRNRDRAAEFVPVLIEKGLDASEADFSFSSDGGFDTWIATGDSELPSLALTDDWLVIASGERGLREVLAHMSGAAETSLLDHPRFIAASEVMVDGHFVSAYFNAGDPGARGIDLVDGFSGLFGEAEWVAASAAWIDDGIILEVVMPAGPDYGFDFPALVDPGGLVPLGTLALTAASFDPDLDKWRSALSDYSLADDVGLDREDLDTLLGDGFFGVEVDAELQGGEDPSLADLLDYSLLSISEILEVDLENDVLGNLSGNAVVGVLDYEFNRSGSMFGAPPDELFVLLSHHPAGGDALAGTVDGFLDTMGFRPRSTDVGGDEDATTFRLRDYRPTYVLHHGYLATGLTSGAVEEAVAVQNGDLPSIDSDVNFGRAVEALPEGGNIFAYVGLRDAFARMSAASEGTDAKAYELFADNLASMAAVYGSKDGHSRATVALMLFPE